MTIKYQVIGQKNIAAKNLKKHPDAQLPIGEDDRAALGRSIESNGVFQPLLVLADAATDGKFFVVDGCSRLDSVAADVELPCILIRTNNPRAVALECLATGRKRSTGQRIMAYILLNKRDVLAAAEKGAKIASGGRNPHLADSNETARLTGVLEHFSSAAIAERLKVCREDVLRAIDLFRCVEERILPDIGLNSTRWGEKLDMTDPEDARAHGMMKEILNGVLSGGTAIRTWRKAYGGKMPTTGPAGRPDIKHDQLFRRGLQHLRTVLKCNAWHTIKATDREGLIVLFDEVVGLLPDELRIRLPAAANSRKVG